MVTRVENLDVTQEPMVTQVEDLDATREPIGTRAEDLDVTREPIRFNVMMAMCDRNRGIAYKLKLPWPYLRKDYEHYTTMTSTRKDVQSDKNIVQIRGRITWECCREKERSLPNVLHIIVSRTMKECSHPNVVKIVTCFEEALKFYNTTYRDHVDSVWVMGGAGIYQEAVVHPYCENIYATHVYTDFPSDTFFPAFTDDYVEIGDPRVDGTMQEDDDVQYQFKVYKRRTSGAHTTDCVSVVSTSDNN